MKPSNKFWMPFLDKVGPAAEYLERNPRGAKQLERLMVLVLLGMALWVAGAVVAAVAQVV